MKRYGHNKAGFTILEMMVTIAILAIILSVAFPSMKTYFANADVRAAQQDIVQAIKKAKQYAKTLNTTVTVTLTTNQADNTVSFALPDGSNTLPDGKTMSAVILPSRVSVTATKASYSFNSQGIVNNLGSIKVVSGADSTVVKNIRVLNLLGQLQVD